MNGLAQVEVHQVALTSVRAHARGVGDEVLYAAIGVWADLSVLPDRVLPWALEGDLPAAYLVDAYLLPDDTRIALSMAAMETFPDPSRDPDDPADEVPFTMVLPTAAVALATALEQAPIGFKIVVFDGLPPAQPEFAAMDLDEVAIVVEMDPGLTHDALHGTVEPNLHMPLPFPEDHDHDAGPETMRDTLFAMTSGIALGQRHALNQAVGWGQFVQSLAVADGNEDRVGLLMMAANRLADSSMDAVAEAGTAVALNAFPGRVAGLAERIGSLVEVTALINVADGVPFHRVVAEHGFDKAIPALLVVAAARAVAVADAEAEAGVSPSWLVGAWLDEFLDEPSWAVRPLQSLLAAHDSAVATDLLGVGPAGAPVEEAGLLLQRYLHVCAEALIDLDLEVPALEAALAANPIRPANYPDMVLLASTMLGAAIEEVEDSDGHTCPGCAGCEAVRVSGWDLKRLAAAAGALLPCLADLSAAQQRLGVGEADWVQHRVTFLGHWLDLAARSAAAGDAAAA